MESRLHRAGVLMCTNLFKLSDVQVDRCVLVWRLHRAGVLVCIKAFRYSGRSLCVGVEGILSRRTDVYTSIQDFRC